jgi:hypothetical protein
MKVKVVVLMFALVAMVVGWMPSEQASAMTLTGYSASLGCTSLYRLAFTMTFDRDNTGTGQEDFYVVITDGKGKVIHAGGGFGPVGMSIPHPAGTLVYNTSLPEFNPLTMKIVSSAGNNLPEQIVYQTTGMCAGLPWATPPGPTHPAGFEQHDIICDTAVYDAPGGSPVGEDMVYAGQDWHVNPEPEMGPDGQYWTQIFVGGDDLGYVPTGCVGGKTVWN